MSGIYVVKSCPSAPTFVGRQCKLDALGGTSSGFKSSGFRKQGDGSYKNDANTVIVPLNVCQEAPTTYPDGNPKSLQGAKKYSLRYLPLSANIAVNQALEDGAKKYGPANWRETGVAISVYIDAALRHINQFYDGKQDNALDSGAPNLGHAMACMAIVIDAMAEGSAIDDRPFAAKDTDALLKRPGV